jgi:hypothetical protein
MEKTKGILINLYLNYVDNNFDNDILSIEDLRSALYEVLDNQEIFILDLAIYIQESKKKDFYENDSNREYYKKLKALWENFSVNDLTELRENCNNLIIKNIINKMVILKTDYKKFNQEVVELDFEDYFYQKNKLIELIL